MADDKFFLFCAIVGVPSMIGAPILEWFRRRRYPDAVSYAGRFFRGLSCVMVSLFGIGMTIVILESVIPTAMAAATLLLLVLADAALGLYGVVVIKRGFRTDRGAISASR